MSMCPLRSRQATVKRADRRSYTFLMLGTRDAEQEPAQAALKHGSHATTTEGPLSLITVRLVELQAAKAAQSAKLHRTLSIHKIDHGKTNDYHMHIRSKPG